MRRIGKTKSSLARPACTLALLGGAALSGRAQDALQSALAGDKSYQARSATVARPPEEWLRTGPASYTLALSYGLEWNDNIRYAATNQAADFIHTPQANVHAFWPVTDQSTLTVGAGVGYQFYTDHSDLSRLFLSPDSELAWDIHVRDFVFTVYDRFLYSREVVNQGALSGTAEFPRLENTAGLRVRWLPDRYVLEAGYGHFTFYSDSKTFDYLNRSAEQFFGRAGYRFAEITQAGAEVSGSFTSYDAAGRGDNRNVSLGPYVTWQITEATSLTLHGGYVLYRFEAGATNAPARDLTSWYVSAELRNRLTDDFTHSLSVSRDVQQGFNPGSESIELLAWRYAVAWAFHRQGTLLADALYEHGSEPQFGVNETYDRYGFGVTGTWQFHRHFSAGLGYRWMDKNSSLAPRDYRVNTVTLNVSYRF